MFFNAGDVADKAPDEMAKAEREGELDGFSYHGGLDLRHEGRIRPTSPAADMAIAYMESSIALCTAALATYGGRGTDDRLVPSVRQEAQACGGLGLFLFQMGEEPRGVDHLRQAVSLSRTATPDDDSQLLVCWLNIFGASLGARVNPNL